MKVEQKGHSVIIKNTQDEVVAFLMKVTHEYKTFEKHNIILDVSHCKSISDKDIKSFLPLSKTHKKAKKSFVVVANGIDFNAVPEKLIVVPTLLEAHDIIEMEEIERDLGF